MRPMRAKISAAVIAPPSSIRRVGMASDTTLLACQEGRANATRLESRASLSQPATGNRQPS